MMKQLTITTVADPMMGLLWQTWPTHRKLETHFGDQIRFTTLMGQLVPDVYQLVDRQVMRKLGKTVALNQYWVRLMQIYLQEQEIGNMPIYMGGNERLFDDHHTTSLPLGKGFRAIAGHDSALEDQVLYEMQYDTVVNDRQTNGMPYLKELARRFGMSADQFTAQYGSTELSDQMNQEQATIQQMKIQQLPAYLVSYDGKTYMINGIPKYADWLKMIDQITGQAIKPVNVEFTKDQVMRLINRHPHISSRELAAAFDVDDEQKVVEMLQQEHLEATRVKDTIFYRQN